MDNNYYSEQQKKIKTLMQNSKFHFSAHKSNFPEKTKKPVKRN